MEYPTNVIQGWRFRLGGIEEIVRRDVVIESQRRKIAPLFIRGQAIGDQDIINPPRVQRPDERTTDKSRAASNEDLAF